MAQVPGGDLIVRMLKEEGVDVVFGIIDGTYFGLYSRFQEHGIRLITPRHETSALHMAGAYARLTGKLGVAIASNGPGVANALPGVAVENGEGNRVFLITSCRRFPIIYPDRGGAFQYFNQNATIKPMSKWSGVVPAYERLPELLRRALRKSWQGRPGVVHLDIPENIMNGKVPEGDPVLPVSSYRNVTRIAPAPVQVDAAARLLLSANQPLIHAGSGVLHSGAGDLLRELAEKIQAPITTSWAGRGVVDETHPNVISMVHLNLIKVVRNHADVVLGLGSRLGETDWWGKPPYWAPPGQQKLIQVDIDEELLGVNKPAELSVLADAGRFLEALLSKLRNSPDAENLTARRARVASWKQATAINRTKLDKAITAETKGGVPSAAVPATCQEVFGDDTVWVTDGGNTAVWGAFYLTLRKPHHFISSFKFGMLGAGTSQALGAQVACPGKRVVCITGDGAMGFHPTEIETAVRNHLPVVFVVLADRQWGMVKINQQFALKPVKTLIKKSLPPEETINADLGEIEWDALARAMGAHGERVSTVAELKPALERARNAGQPAIVHVDVDPVKHLWAPALKTFKDMHQEPGGK